MLPRDRTIYPRLYLFILSLLGVKFRSLIVDGRQKTPEHCNRFLKEDQLGRTGTVARVSSQWRFVPIALILCLTYTMSCGEEDHPCRVPFWCLFSVGNFINMCSFSVTIAYHCILSLLLKVLFRVCRNRSDSETHTQKKT